LNISADLQKVLELLAQGAVDAEAIGAVSCELTITDPHGAGVMYRYTGQSSEFKPAEPEWH
jgi:hypothetical protein